MQTKSVREMSKNERKFHSLSGRVIRLILLGAALMGVVVLFIGLGLYSVAVANQYINTAFNLSRTASKILQEAGNTEDISAEVWNRYSSMTDAERAEVNTHEYKARFTDLLDREDYRRINTILDFYLESSDVYDIYLAQYDRDRDALVYIVDPSDSDVSLPGYWEPVTSLETEKFLGWNGEGMLYDISNTDKYGWMCTAGVPMKNEAGETYGFILADIMLKDFVERLGSFALQYAVALAVLVIIFGLLVLRNLNKRMVVPINAMADAAQTYVRDKRDNAQITDRFASLKIFTGDEIENLALSMSEMEKDLAEYEQNLTKVTAEKQRIGTELKLANRIQSDMLPHIFPAFPERRDFAVYASMTPAKEVGGDFYDFFLIDQNRLALVIADVSGKGIPAAMFMMMAKNMLQTQAVIERGPKEVLETVNRKICANNQEEMFVTVWFAIIDLRSGHISAANAGHEYPILKTADGSFEVLSDPHGFVLGGFDEIQYQEYELQMEVGSKLFVYTDGVLESTNRDTQPFGIERTLQALNEKKDGSPEEILQSVEDAVTRFVDGAEQFDDLSMMCFEYKGPCT